MPFGATLVAYPPSVDPAMEGIVMAMAPANPANLVSRVRTIGEVVRAAGQIVEIERRGRLDRLDLVGHGAPGLLLLRRGSAVAPQRILSVETVAALSGLEVALAEDGVLRLLACGLAGRDEAGRQKARELIAALDHLLGRQVLALVEARLGHDQFGPDGLCPGAVFLSSRPGSP